MMLVALRRGRSDMDTISPCDARGPSPGTDIDVTMAIYAHTNLDAKRQALDAIDWEAP